MPRRNLKKSCRSLINSELVKLKYLPKNRDIIKRRISLQNEYIGKCKSAFLSVLSKEIAECWKKQDIPVQDWRTILNKLKRTKIPDNENLFDCLSSKPVWKCNEDKQYYMNQLNSLGGFCSSKIVPYRIHPSRKTKWPIGTNINNNENVENINEEINDSDPPHNHNFKKAVQFAVELREIGNLSISQTIAVMNFYAINYPNMNIMNAPSRSSISTACRKEAANISNNIVFNEINQTLYFDMKSYQNLYHKKREMLCVRVNEQLVEFTEIPNKKAATIASFLLPVLCKYTIKTIVSDTEPTITGSKNGVIELIKRQIPDITYEPCRLHILDLILKNEIKFFLGNVTSSSPNIPYPFVQDIYNRWSELRYEYLKSERLPSLTFADMPLTENRRDDYRYLLELCNAIRTSREAGYKPFVKIPLHPVNICLARWNSKAIYCLMLELFQDESSYDILSLNFFIAYEWAPLWFGVRNVADWSKLNSLSDKSKLILTKHGLHGKVETRPETNEMAERIFRMANEKIHRCTNVNDLRNFMIRYVNVSCKLNDS